MKPMPAWVSCEPWLLATAALLSAMKRSGFAIGTAWQQSSMPLTAVVGWLAFGDALSPLAWIGVGVTTLGLAALAIPDAVKAQGGDRFSGAVFGLLSGLCFGYSLNAYRHATLILSPGAPLLGATATVAGRRVAVGNRKLMIEEGVEFGALMSRRDELASSGRTAVLVAVDGRGVGVIALADAARETSAAAVAALHDLDVQVVMLSGDNQATAERIAGQLGIDTVEELLQRVDVARHPGEQPPGALVGVEVDRQPLQVGEDAQAELVQQLLAEATRERHAAATCDGGDDHRGDVEQCDEHHHAGVARRDPRLRRPPDCRPRRLRQSRGGEPWRSRRQRR